jgi:molecular chaperone IbpA
MTTKLDLERFFVGFDQFYNHPLMNQKIEYPRYNIGKTGNEGYSLMIALPGWTTEAISVQLHNGELTVKGVKQDSETDIEWLHKGISGKAFEKVFKVDNSLDVTTAKLENGMLNISLEYTPSSKPVTIPVE